MRSKHYRPVVDLQSNLTQSLLDSIPNLLNSINRTEFFEKKIADNSLTTHQVLACENPLNFVLDVRQFIFETQKFNWSKTAAHHENDKILSSKNFNQRPLPTRQLFSKWNIDIVSYFKLIKRKNNMTTFSLIILILFWTSFYMFHIWFYQRFQSDRFFYMLLITSSSEVFVENII